MWNQLDSDYWRTTIILSVFLVFVLVVAGCDSEPVVDTPPGSGAGVEEGTDPGVETAPVEPPISPPLVPSIEAGSTTVRIRAMEGGTVSLPAGTTLIIPPEALAEDADISVSQPAAAEFGPSVLTAVVLEPSGLVLSRPAQIEVAFDPAFGADPEGLQLYTTTTAEGGWASSGERSGLDPLDTTINEATGTASAMISHFSSIHLQHHPAIYVALDIHRRYLEPGDILYALTGGVSFAGARDWPIHVGLFAGGNRVVESTLPTDNCSDGFFPGVGENPFSGESGFTTLCGEHIYLGARRPQGWTEEMGEQAVEAARGYFGRTWGAFIFAESTFLGPQGISCVELAEDAWESAGINISLVNDFLLSPGIQYDATSPVNHIRARVGDEVRVGLIAAVRDENDHYTSVGDQPDHPPATVVVLPNPDNLDRELVVEPVERITVWGTRPPQQIAYLVYTPTADDVGRTLSWNATIDVPSTGAHWQSPNVLEIEVIDAGLCADRVEGGVTTWAGTWTGTCVGAFSVDGVELTLEPRSDHFELTLNTDVLADGTTAPEHNGTLNLTGRPWAADTTAGSHIWWSIDSYGGPRPSGHLGGFNRFSCSPSMGPVMADTGRVTIQIADDCATINVFVEADYRNIDWLLRGTFEGTEVLD